jgi:aminopeptidase N
MAKYTVRIEADKSLYPVLLSNGNLLGQGDLEVTSPVMQISLLHPQKNKKKSTI